MKLWDKGASLRREVEKFTVGNDHLLDKRLVKFDCLASIAHAKMLKRINLLSEDELNQLVQGLKEIIKLDSQGNFKITQEDEDCHTAIENFLVGKYGETGKKIHVARSRNDQVLTALRLYEKDALLRIKEKIEDFVKAIKLPIRKYGDVRLSGYTHMQRAMPTDVKTWLGSYLSSMRDNLLLVDTALKLIDQNPLGSAAGFGVPIFKIDKKMTAEEMGFSRVMENPMYCQLSRGKFEAQLMNTVSAVMYDLNRLATDLMIFSMEEFGYVGFAPDFYTGSSIMPQKKNPDVLELLRAKYHVVLGEEFKVKSLSGNLMSGYNRDVQLTKEPLMNSLDIVEESLAVASLIISGMEINRDACEKSLTPGIYATEEAYELVRAGMPFRDAYRAVGEKYKDKSS